MSLSMPPENVRKPLVTSGFLMFSGVWKETSGNKLLLNTLATLLNAK